MMSGMLKQTTAMVVCLALVAPVPAVAQSVSGGVKVQGNIAGEVPLTAQIGAQEENDAISITDEEEAVSAKVLRKKLRQEARAAEKRAAKAAERVEEARAAVQATEAGSEARVQAGVKLKAARDAKVQADREAADAVAAFEGAAQSARKAARDAETEVTVTETGELTDAERAERKKARRAARIAAEQEEADAEADLAAKLARKAEKKAQADADAKLAAKLERKAAKQAQDDADAMSEKEAKLEERRAKRQAERQEKRRAAKAARKDARAADVSDEEVTRDNSRSSDEDFTTGVTGNAQVTQDSGGLSKFEKALLLGLGAVVVGKVLSNGDEVVSNSGDRVVVRRDGDLRVLKNDNVLLRQPGAQVRTETFDDGSTRTTVTRQNGERVITIAAADGTVIERVLVRSDGTEVVLIDDTVDVAPVEVATLAPARVQATTAGGSNAAALRAALQSTNASAVGRTFSLSQVRDIRPVRELVPTIELDAVTFDTGSAAIRPTEAEELAAVGNAIVEAINDDPGSIFLIEGHTDAVGGDAYNLALSDRRAESVALALIEYFNVPSENLVTQGYGESALKVPTLQAERANRRAAVRNVTPLLR